MRMTSTELVASCTKKNELSHSLSIPCIYPVVIADSQRQLLSIYTSRVHKEQENGCEVKKCCEVSKQVTFFSSNDSDELQFDDHLYLNHSCYLCKKLR